MAEINTGAIGLEVDAGWFGELWNCVISRGTAVECECPLWSLFQLSPTGQQYGTTTNSTWKWHIAVQGPHWANATRNRIVLRCVRWIGLEDKREGVPDRLRIRKLHFHIYPQAAQLPSRSPFHVSSR